MLVLSILIYWTILNRQSKLESATVLFQCDDFPVSEKVALQLAGLQAQVNLGDPQDVKSFESYMDVDSYLPYRVSRSRGEDVWVSYILQQYLSPARVDV